MKNLKFIILSCLIIIFSACDSEDTPKEEAVFAVPIVKSMADIRSGVSVSTTRQTNSEGKIYVAEDYLFYIAKEEGVHIFDNNNPAAPQNIAFINIEGVHDIAVKGQFLYADNFVDLLVFDISDLSNITLIKTVENSLTFSPTFPIDAEFYDYTVMTNPGEIVVGYRLENRARPEGQNFILATDGLTGLESSSTDQIGVGGSYARFQILNNALYTIEAYKLNVFNIEDPVNAFFDKEVFICSKK